MKREKNEKQKKKKTDEKQGEGWEKKNRGNRMTFSRLGKIERNMCLKIRGAENKEE